MADWIPIRTNIFEDPRIAQIAAELDRSEFEVVGMVLRLWSMADDQTEDGLLKGLTTKALDRKLQCPGIAAALMAVDWLQQVEQGLLIPRFDKYCSETAKKRATESKRKRKYREEQERLAAEVREQEQQEYLAERQREQRESAERQQGTANESAELPVDRRPVRQKQPTGTTVPPETGQCPETVPTERDSGPVFFGHLAPQQQHIQQQQHLEQNHIPPPPPKSPTDPAVPWSLLTQRAAAAGLEHWNCLSAAVNNGLPHREILRVIDFFCEKAPQVGWTAAALHKRLTDAFPGQPVDRGWPKPDPKALAQQQAAVSRQAESHRQQQEDSRRKAQQQAQERREIDFGGQLDGLSAAEQRALAYGISSDLGRRYDQIGATGVVRVQLLLKLERQAVGSVVVEA